MARPSSGIVFGAPDRGKGSPRRVGRGRRCTEPGCDTVLSTYNPSQTCYLHTMPTMAPPLQRSL
jgi:hypothetical protein